MYIRRRIDQQKNEIDWIKHQREDENSIQKWETEFARFIGVRYAKVIPSGRAGLVHILSKLNLIQGDEVIIPAYTLKDLVPLIKNFGAKVIAADISKKDFNIDPGDIKEKITGRTKLIIAAHIFGCPCDMTAIMNIAIKHRIFVLEDCAHSAGSRIGKKQTGSIGHAAFFSFENIKPINTYGGGMIVSDSIDVVEGQKTITKNRQVTRKAWTAWLENTLVQSSLSFVPLYLMSTSLSKYVKRLYRFVQGTPHINGGYSSVQAKLGLLRLKSLNARIMKRRALATAYKTLLDIPMQPDRGHNYYFMVGLIRGDTRRFKKCMIKRGIDVGIREEVTDFCGDVSCPNARYVYEHAVQLPMHEGLSKTDIMKICRIVRANEINT